MSRRTLAIVAAIVVVVAGIGFWVWMAAVEAGKGTPSDDDTVPQHLAPDELAAQACDYATQTLPQQVADDVAADEVLAGLDHARSLAQTAADRQARWVALASGMATLERAVKADDAGATDLALRVVQAECE